MAIIIPGQAGAIDHIDSTPARLPRSSRRSYPAACCDWVARILIRLPRPRFTSIKEIGSDRFVSGIGRRCSFAAANQAAAKLAAIPKQRLFAPCSER